MPTGYTAPVMDGEVTELRDFMLIIGRAFASFIHQRDEAPNVPPRMPKFDSYHERALEQAQERLREVTQMTLEQAEVEQNAAISAAIHRDEEAIAKAAIVKDRYERMIEKVEAWVPPTPKHERVKEFALEQLRESVRFDGGYRSRIPQRLTPEEYREQEIKDARKDVNYHAEQLGEAKKRHAENVEWIEQFFGSLPEPVKGA